VGLDPQYHLLPEPLTTCSETADLASQAAAYREFCRGVMDVVAGRVAAVKPQAAFFEELGPIGAQVLADTIAYAGAQGLIVVLDAKRGDIGSTASAYARGILGPGGTSPWGADAVTVNPYLGGDSLAPFVEVALARDAGVFVLVKTSNPGGRMFQDLTSDGRPVYRHVAEHVEHLALQTLGACGYGSVGGVVGATYPEQLHELRRIMPHALLLVPGYGAQGGAARDVAAAFDSEGLGALINSSRAIIFAHRRAEYAGRFRPDQWQDAVAAATDEMIEQLRAETPAGRLADR
jgi:orotidine-5'-phosphate decarboxylase